MWAVLAWDAGDRRAKGRMGWDVDHHHHRPSSIDLVLLALPPSLTSLRYSPAELYQQLLLGTVNFGLERERERERQPTAPNTREDDPSSVSRLSSVGFGGGARRVDDGTAE